MANTNRIKYLPKRSPGPWYVNANIKHGAPEVINKSRRIAKILYDPGSEDNEVHNNAQLIAMAPELLQEIVVSEQTLRNLSSEYINDDHQIIIRNRTKRMRDLIRLATGRPDYYAWEKE